MNTIVSTDWLAEHLHDSNLRVVDIRGHVVPAGQPLPHYFSHHEEYETSHLPGAVFVDWTRDITDPDDPLQAQIAKPERFAAAMGRIGIGPNTFVVTYDAGGGMFAARLWWALNYYCHEQVAVLDGGWTKWVAEGRPTTAEVPQVEAVYFTARPNPALRRTADEVAARSADTTLLDVRTPGEFTGQVSRAKRMGHIPGAVNLPRASFFAADHTLRPADELRQLFAQQGVTPESPEVITYCNGGVAGSHGLLALRQAGIDNSALYDGSWKDWGNDDSRPIETEA